MFFGVLTAFLTLSGLLMILNGVMSKDVFSFKILLGIVGLVLSRIVTEIQLFCFEIEYDKNQQSLMKRISHHEVVSSRKSS